MLFYLKLHSKRSLLLLSFNSNLQYLNLILKQLVHKYAQFFNIDFSWFVLWQHAKDVIMAIVEGCIGLSLDLIAF